MVTVCVLDTRLCPTLCDPKDCSPPGSSVHGILQARIPEWGAVSFSRGSSWPRDRTWVSCTAGRFFAVWAPGKPSESCGHWKEHSNAWAGKGSLVLVRAGRVPASVRCSANSQVATSALFRTFHVLHTVCVRRGMKAMPRGLCSQVLKLDSTPSPGMGNTCNSMADSCQCMTKTTTLL